MATDIFLIRRTGNPRSVKYSAVSEVLLSGLRTAYASVTGVATTNVITVTGATLADGMQVILTELTGGVGLSTGIAYFAVNSSGATCKLSTVEGGSAEDFTTDITAASVIVVNPQMRVWSAEYRDIFQTSTTGSIPNVGGTLSFGLTTQGQMKSVEYLTALSGTSNTITPTFDGQSDDSTHSPLRQTFVNRSFWIFDRGASIAPRYLYAEYQSGDVISDNRPNT